jgi:hypothetical protein
MESPCLLPVPESPVAVDKENAPVFSLSLFNHAFHPFSILWPKKEKQLTKERIIIT